MYELFTSNPNDSANSSQIFVNFSNAENMEGQTVIQIPYGTYKLRVSGSNSVWSNLYTITIQKPSPPTNLIATANKKGEVELSWTEGNPKGLLATYIVEKDIGGSFQVINFDYVHSPSYVAGNYPPSITRTFRIRALYFGPSGEISGSSGSWDIKDGTYSDYTNTATVTTLPKPQAPTLFAAAGPNDSVVLSWIGNDSDGLAGYSIYDSSDNLLTSGSTDQVYTVPDLTSGTQYCYVVVANVNVNNNSDPSNIACATALDNVSNWPISSTDPASSVTGSDIFNLTTTDSGISSVDLIIDGTQVGVDTSPPYAVTFDSTQFINGQHNGYFVVNYPSPKPPTATAPIQITVNNPVSPTTPPTTGTLPGSITATATYSCPSGYSISGTTCTKTSSDYKCSSKYNFSDFELLLLSWLLLSNFI